MTSSRDVRELLDRATAAGWEYVGRSGSGHHRMRWPHTGQVVTVASTPGPRSLPNSEADMAAISGPLRPRPGPGRTKAQRAADRRRASMTRRPVAAVAAPARPDWQAALADWAATHLTEEAEPYRDLREELAVKLAEIMSGGEMDMVLPMTRRWADRLLADREIEIRFA